VNDFHHGGCHLGQKKATEASFAPGLFSLSTLQECHSTIGDIAEAVAEELLPYKEMFSSVVPGQYHKAAATSCFRVYSSWSFLL